MSTDGVQRRTMAVLVLSQVLGGVGVASGIAVSSLIAAQLSGSDVVGGAAFTALVLGAAAAAYPMSRLASARGRRPALVTGYLAGVLGAGGAAAAVAAGSAMLLLAAMVVFGAATAAGLSARFAATDLAPVGGRARALAAVVFAVTVGAVAGPNIAAPAQAAAERLGWPPGSGPFVLCALTFGLAALVIGVALRPDPLLLARERGADPADSGRGARVGAWRALRAAPLAQLAVAGIVVCHLVMIAVMSMTPVHMHHGGASLSLVGLVISLHVAGMYGLSPVFGVLADRWGALPVLTLGAGLLVVACGCAALAGGHDVGLLTAGLVALGLGWSAGLVAGSALLTAAVPLPDRAGVQGLSDMAMNAGGAVGGLLAGVAVAVSSYAVLGAVAAALVAPLLAILLAAPRGRVGAYHKLRA